MSGTDDIPLRLGILATHPIQYHAPWFRHLAQRFDLEVFFAHQQDAAGQAAAGFMVPFEWDVPLLEGYRYRWLRNVARRPSVGSFRGCDTPELSELIANGGFDAVLVCGWNKKCFLQALAACKKQGVPILVRGDSQLNSRRSYLKAAAKHVAYRWFLRRFDAHLFVGRRNHEYLVHYGVPKDRLYFCPHFVDNEFFASRAAWAAGTGASARVRQELGIPSDGFVFLFVGKLLERKRPADLINACLKAFPTPAGAGAYAVFVGDGPLRESLNQHASIMSDRIRFAGFRNQSELPAYYQAADALVLPSDASETWGLVVNEAMACGRPCIVSDAAGCGPDLVDNADTGFDFPLGDTDALAERMLALRSRVRQNPESVLTALAAKTQQFSLASATNGLAGALEAIVVRRQGFRTPRMPIPFTSRAKVR
ncbi:MAG TPA: glycosyltransferase family 4 protein [Pirellulales bacterium]|nr:glycosyltransferase family 4 protein [Pirellulales bacterium]